MAESNDEIFRSIGAIWGATLATLRNENRVFYSSSMGANFFLLGSTYTTLEECIADKVGYKSMVTAAVSGASTGGFYGGLVGGTPRGIQGALAGAALAFTVHVGKVQFEKWRIVKGKERLRSKYGIWDQEADDPTLIEETKSLDIEKVLPSFLPKAVKISDDEIERRIQARMEDLRKGSKN
uniref:Uncharacterized protein AlNc14C117G6565 n=1 Tax=Albugo laibachii Nc14 TaxID=890382 RepID=F0WJ34_9STRA|nr:conserved hypothetical protein [Albugo laibachii Nc14]CCA21653.1 conserved hypothetical protein [Albugo laibachii Nc14]|eukprot:CCA21653.1 conserved hypothetical protein [Albugo laibachii Nc14]